MKILIAVHHFPPRYTGGAEWQAYRIGCTLQARGHEVQVACVEHVDRGPAGAVEWEDDHYEAVPVRRLSFNRRFVPDVDKWEYDNPWIGAHLEQWLAEVRPDVFHLVSGYLMSGRALCAALDANIPTVVSLMDFWFLCRRLSMLRSDEHLSTLPVRPEVCARCIGEERGLYRRLAQLFPGAMALYWRRQNRAIENMKVRQQFLMGALTRASAVISNSQFLRTFFIQAGVDAQRIQFIRQGIDSPQKASVEKRRSSISTLRVGYIGQIARLKGVHVLFEAVQHLPEAALNVKVYGNPDAFPDYTARLRKIMARDDRLQFAGVYRGHAELDRILADMDVIVVPSLWYENSPNVILEAFAHRVPVIATNLGGMAELVQHDVNGLLFEMGDARDLANQLRWLLQERSLLPRLVAGIGPVKTVEQEIDELEAVYEQAIESRLLSGENAVRWAHSSHGLGEPDITHKAA